MYRAAVSMYSEVWLVHYAICIHPSAIRVYVEHAFWNTHSHKTFIENVEYDIWRHKNAYISLDRGHEIRLYPDVTVNINVAVDRTHFCVCGFIAGDVSSDFSTNSTNPPSTTRDTTITAAATGTTKDVVGE